MPVPSTALRLERLYTLACKEQWRLESLSWDQLDISELPGFIRQAAAELLVQLQLGELTAMQVAASLVVVHPMLAAKQVFATQAQDEARHMRFFALLLEKLGCSAEVRPVVSGLMQEISAATTIEEKLLGLLLIESLAHSCFLEGFKLLKQLQAPPAFQQVLGVWLPELLAGDERRHLAIQILCLKEQFLIMSPLEKELLARRLAAWKMVIEQSASEPELIDGVGLDGKAIGQRCIEELQLHLQQVGLGSP
jgi:hypothetical protein